MFTVYYSVIQKNKEWYIKLYLQYNLVMYHICLQEKNGKQFFQMLIEITSACENESISHSVMCHSSEFYGLQTARLLCPWNSPSKKTRVGSHFFLQRIFFTQGSNPHLLHWKQILYHVSHHNELQILFTFFSVCIFLHFANLLHMDVLP